MRRYWLIFVLALFCGNTFAGLTELSCTANDFHEYAAVGAMPGVNFLSEKERNRWQAPACIPWVMKSARALVSTAGRFSHAGDTTALLSRFAAVSDMTEIRYWSVTRQAWKPLFKVSYAVDAITEARRDDFSMTELGIGSIVHLWQREAYLPKALEMEMRVLERSPNRLVITMANTAPVKWMFSRIIESGDYEFYYLLEREDASTWRYYNVTRLVGGGMAMAFLPDESFVNRAVAIFRYISGYATDTEPPVARDRK